MWKSPVTFPDLISTASGGNGTIEAVLYMEPSRLERSVHRTCSAGFHPAPCPAARTIIELLADYDGYIYYQNQATGNSAGQLVWAVPGGLLEQTHPYRHLPSRAGRM